MNGAAKMNQTGVAIHVDRHAVVRVGQPDGMIGIEPQDDGTAVLVVQKDGVRVVVQMAAARAVQIGSSVIIAGGEADRRARLPRAEPPIITGARP